MPGKGVLLGRDEVGLEAAGKTTPEGRQLEFAQPFDFPYLTLNCLSNNMLNISRNATGGSLKYVLQLIMPQSQNLDADHRHLNMTAKLTPR